CRHRYLPSPIAAHIIIVSCLSHPKPFRQRRLTESAMKYAGAICLVAVVAAHRVHAQDAKPSPAALQFFESKVRPLLAENCFQCHGEKKQRGSLRLDSLATILEGGDQGPAIVPGHPEKSLLVKAISHTDPDFKMPPTKKLSREQIADLTNWIKMGAPWPAGGKAGPP